MRHLRLYRATFAASRLLNKSRAGKIVSRSVRSTAGGNFANSQIKISDEERRGQQSMNSPLCSEEDFPPLSVNKGVKSKRRNRVDLVTCSKQKPEPEPEPDVAQNVVPLQRKEAIFEGIHKFDPLQREAPTRIIDHNDMGLPTSFGKKPSLKSPKLRQNGHDHRDPKRRPKPSSVAPVDEPFDICPCETTQSNTRNKQMWSPMSEPDERGSNTEDFVEETRLVLGPGMVLLKRYIPLSEQVNIVNKCRELGIGPGGFYRPGYNDGAKLRLYMMCLGLDWDPQTAKYADRRCHDNAAPPDLPNEFTSLVCRSLNDSHDLIQRNLNIDSADGILPKMSPDVCIVNFYTSNGRLGLHQDRDETRESLEKGLPVVSLSIGDTAEFLYGEQRDVNRAKSVSLESGDVLIFGGESRHVYHGVKAIVPDTAPPGLLESTRLRPGRLNLTFRKY